MPIREALRLQIERGLSVRYGHTAAVREYSLRYIHDCWFDDLSIVAELEFEDPLSAVIGHAKRVTGNGHGVGPQQGIQGAPT
jgi:hypothetical protein